MEIFLDAMKQEGSAVLKPPCNNDDMINPDDPTCLKGSPFVSERALAVLVGSLASKNVTLVNYDDFHPAAETVHYHHPELDSDCDETASEECTITHYSVTENTYSTLKEDKISQTPIAAKEMRVKLKSSQIIHQDAAEKDADFATLDQ